MGKYITWLKIIYFSFRAVRTVVHLSRPGYIIFWAFDILILRLIEVYNRSRELQRGEVSKIKTNRSSKGLDSKRVYSCKFLLRAPTLNSLQKCLIQRFQTLFRGSVYILMGPMGYPHLKEQIPQNYVRLGFKSSPQCSNNIIYLTKKSHSVQSYRSV